MTLKERADVIVATTRTPGWQEIERMFDALETTHIELLKTERDYQKLTYSQAVIRAVQHIRAEIEDAMNQGGQ